MIQFDLIENQKLRLLIMNSPSLKVLSAKRFNEFIKRIITLPPAGVTMMIDFLEQEKSYKHKASNQILSALSPASFSKNSSLELAGLQSKIAKISIIKHTLEKTILKEKEKEERNTSDSSADELLNNI